MLLPRSSSAAARSLWRTSVPLTRAMTGSSCARAIGIARIPAIASAETRRLAQDNALRADNGSRCKDGSFGPGINAPAIGGGHSRKRTLLATGDWWARLALL